MYKLDGLIHRVRRTQHCCQRRLSSWQAAFITHTRRFRPNLDAQRPFDHRLGATLVRCSQYFPVPDVWFEPAFTECLLVPEFGQNASHGFLRREHLGTSGNTHNDGIYSALHLAIDANRMDLDIFFSKMLLHPAVRSKHFDVNVEMQRLELSSVVLQPHQWCGQGRRNDTVGWTCNWDPR